MKLKFVVLKYIKRYHGVEVTRKDSYEEALTYIEKELKNKGWGNIKEFYVQCVYTED